MPKRSLPVPTLLLRTPTLHYPLLQNCHPQISILLPHFNYNKITSSIININISIKTLHILPTTTVSTSILLIFYYIISQQHYITSKRYFHLYYFNFNFNLDCSTSVSYTHLDVYKRQSLIWSLDST